jgi:gliding motility-associated-like protein
VKWIEDRREHLLTTNHARDAECELEIACDRDGTILALRGRAFTNQGAYIRTNGPTAARNIAQVLTGPYRIPHVRIDVALMVTNGNGCASTVTIANKIVVQEHPVARFVIRPEELSIIYPRVEFINQSIFSDIWEWNFGDSALASGFSSVHTYQQSGSFLASLVASNTIGCTDTSFREILVRPEMVLFAANAFSPNGDGKNETFSLSSTSVAGFSIVIFNRWGEKVFVSTNPWEEWNGTFRNTGASSPPGVYYWVAEATDEYGNSQAFHGSVTLLR